MTAPQSVALIREALEAGPTAGKWEVDGRFNEWAISSDHSIKGPCISGRQFVACCFRVSKKDTPRYAAMFEATARYIAACSPSAIAEVLQHVAALSAQVREMEADARRYRLIRDTEGAMEVFSMAVGLSYCYQGADRVKMLDDALDAALSAAARGE